MMKKMIIRCALLGAVACLAAACFGNKDYKNEYDTQILVRFEPDNTYDWDEFVDQFFNGGQDTVSINVNFSVGPIYHFAKVDDDQKQLVGGGLVICRGKDTDASPERKPSRFAVYDEECGHLGSKAYAVFHDTTATLMPEHSIQIAIPNTDSSCSLLGLYVHNVQAAVQAARYGVGLADGPFTDADYLTLSITCLKGTTQVDRKEVKLVDGTKIVEEWTEVELTDSGKIDAVDLHLTCSRPDFPLYCCLDNVGYHYIEIYY